MDLLCMDGAEVSMAMACICSNRSCPCCWCPDSQLDDTQSTCNLLQVQRAKDVFSQLDIAWEQLLDDEDCVLRGKTKAVTETERKLKYKLLHRSVWRLIEFFKLFMPCPKDELFQWYVVYTWYIPGITLTYL